MRPTNDNREAEACMACAIAFRPGDRFYPEVDGGFIHAACCGPERESYVDADGDPLGPDNPIPPPSIWTWAVG